MSGPQLRMRRWSLEDLALAPSNPQIMASPLGEGRVGVEGVTSSLRSQTRGGPDAVDPTPTPPQREGHRREGDLPLVRLARPEDAPALARVLTLAFGEEWSETRVRRELLDHPEVPATFVATVDGEVAATASCQLSEEFPQAGWVHWVGADPAHGGKGLGRAVTLAVLHAAREDGKQEAGLTTDDPRLAAIRTYLGLGFEPDPWHESHPARWVAVFERLR